MPLLGPALWLFAFVFGPPEAGEQPPEADTAAVEASAEQADDDGVAIGTVESDQPEGEDTVADDASEDGGDEEDEGVPEEETEVPDEAQANALGGRPGDITGDGRLALPPRHSLVYSNLLAARINPLGLEQRLWIGYRFRLYNKEGALWAPANISLYFAPLVSPALVVARAMVEIMPLAILRLRAGYGFVQFFGNFQFLQSYESPYDDFSDGQLRAEAEAGNNYPGRGGLGTLEALLQAKVWRIAIRNDLKFQRYDFELRDGDDLGYNIRIDALVANNGWSLTNDSDILYLHPLRGGGQITAGARGTLVHAFYPERVYEAGEDSSVNPNGPMYRLGPILAWTIYDRPGTRFNKPSIFVISQWHLAHRWRTGLVEVDRPGMGPATRGSSQAIPTFSIGFAFNGELWGSNGKKK